MGRIVSAWRNWSLVGRFALTSLIVFVIIGFGIANVLGNAARQSALKAAEAEAVSNLQGRLIDHLSPADMGGALSGTNLASFDRLVRRDVLNQNIVVVKVWNPHGVVVYSNEHKLIGRQFPLEDDVESALEGKVFSDVSSLSDEENSLDRRFGKLLQVYIPIRFGNGPVVGAFEIYQSYGPLGAQIGNLQQTTYTILGGGLLVLYVLLFGVVRAGSRTITKQQQQLQAHHDELEANYAQTISSLARAVDAKDQQTEQHSERVQEMALRLGNFIGLGEEQMRSLRNGAQLHDIGKIGVPDEVLLKPGPLTDAEWERMRSHPVIGHDMIQGVSFLQDSLPVVRHHHERWDGAGYPDGLSGERIPLTARIFSIVDTFDAITSDRPYRKGASINKALAIIEQEAGMQFDPILAIAFVAMMSRADQGRPPVTDTLFTLDEAA